MKAFVTVILTSMITLAAQAQNFAVINQEQVLFTSDVAQQENARLQADFGALDQERVALQEDLQSMQRQYETDKDILTDEEVAELQEKANAVQQQLGQLSNQLAQAQQQRQQVFVQQYQPILVEAIKAVLDGTEYDMVLDSTAVIYANDDLDLSQQVLEAFNRLTAGE